MPVQRPPGRPGRRRGDRLTSATTITFDACLVRIARRGWSPVRSPRGVLANPGLQIIGWHLERLPELPPNDAAAPVQKREYTVVRPGQILVIP